MYVCPKDALDQCFTSVPTQTSLSAPSTAASTHHFLWGQSRGTRVCVCEREELTTNGSDLKAFFADKKCELMHTSVCIAVCTGYQ